jgi:hypothetical protein
MTTRTSLDLLERSVSCPRRAILKRIDSKVASGSNRDCHVMIVLARSGDQKRICRQHLCGESTSNTSRLSKGKNIGKIVVSGGDM